MNGVAPLNGVRRIIRLEPRADGKYTPVVLYERAAADATPKKTAPSLRPMERLLCQVAEASAAAAAEYQARHQRSSEKRKNGWLLDLGRNLLKSQQRGTRRIKVRKIVIP